MYREFRPPAPLRDDVRCIWTYESAGDDAPQPIAPDGCCELIVHCGDPYTELPDRRVQPAVLFAGQLTAPFAIVAGARAAVLGVRFAPDGARGFLGRPASSATDQRVDLSDAFGVLAAEARAAPNWDARIAMASAVAAARRIAPDPLVRAAVAAIGAGASVDTGGVSERQFQRRFKDRVGVASRTYAAIVRFRRVFDAIERSPDLVAAALAAGYYDQPQMARDFRRFLGVTARAWAAQRVGLATALAAPGSYKNAAQEAG
ncbi:MAG: helix-turn-helix domain-containing protein [Alphaproteobacteria bacterium]|nr:helix-turn-helix domain-containing protein [Alphaproteobacteria bacterium]